ncbi:MAG TPA: 50S ribosomal protein L23 [Fimbriimonadales bacterium]|nr:50S ribosomal protein L23 [Fimbriimonadales bacterium]
MNKTPDNIIIKPVLTEKSVRLGAEGKYFFYVHPDANKVEIARAIEEIYNAGKKKKDRIKVSKVNVINVHGKSVRRHTLRKAGRRANRKKAIITLMPGQRLEGFEV